MIATTELTVEVIGSQADVGELKPEWEKLLCTARNGSVFQTPTWAREWWNVYGGLRKLAIFTVRTTDGELIGLAPMMLEHSHKLVGFNQLRFIGSWASGQNHFLIAAGWEVEVASILHQAVTKAGQGWARTEFLEMPNPWPDLLGVPTDGVAKIAQMENSCPVVNLAESWDGYLLGLTSKHRHELKRKLRRSSDGGLSYRHVKGGPTLQRDLDSVFDLNLRRWGRQGLWAPGRFAYARRRRFLKAVTQALAAEGRASVHLLESSSRKVAGLLCFEHNDTCYAYLTGMDHEFAALSPGLTVFAEAIKYSISNGMSKFNFICGQHDYKYHLGAIDEPLWGWTELPRD